MESRLPTAKIRTALWISEFSRYLLSLDNIKGDSSYEDFTRIFNREFQQYSSKRRNLPLHQKSNLVLLNGEIRNLESTYQPLKYMLDKNDLFSDRFLSDISKSTFSKWRNAGSSPKKIMQQIARQIHEPSSRWFEVMSYDNRLSRFLYLIDVATSLKRNPSGQRGVAIIKGVLEELSREWEPLVRNNWSSEDSTPVIDFYIPGPSRKACNFKIDPYRDSKAIRKNLIQKPSKDWSTWEHFESVMNECFDLSRIEETFCSLSLGEDVRSKHSLLKPYSVYFMLLSLIVSDELKASDSLLEPDLVMDLCSAGICVHVLSRNIPESKYDVSQYVQGSLMTWLPEAVTCFLLEDWESCRPSNFAYSVMYDLRDSCGELRWPESKIRRSLQRELNTAKSCLKKKGIRLGQEYHYPLLQRCLDVKNVSDNSLNGMVYKDFQDSIVPLISKIFENSPRVDCLKTDRSKNYAFENFRNPNGLVSAAGP